MGGDHTDVDGCEYFAYTIYECELKAEIRPADGLPSDIFWSINPQCEDGPNPDETAQPAPCHEDHVGLHGNDKELCLYDVTQARRPRATPPATRCAASAASTGGGRNRPLWSSARAPRRRRGSTCRSR